MEVALDRDALYYPYIHIRDVNWLKATLLCFPQVRRIVPQHFTLKDLPEVRPFLSVEGARGEPLVTVEPAYLWSVNEAQERLLRRLENAAPELLAKYTREKSISEYGSEADSFLMHEGKIVPLLEFLQRKNLAWQPGKGRTDLRDEWYALHPRLGEAVMSVIAIAIAEERQLDIVTSSGRVHRALASLDEDSVVENILGEAHRKARTSAVPDAEMVDDLAQIVMHTQFDLSKLTAEQIAELQGTGNDLRRFKNELLTITRSIPDIREPVDREKRLKEAAEQVMERWRQYRRSLPRFAVDALISAGSLKTPEVLASLLVGATSTIALASGLGLLIGFGVYAGFGVWRGYKEKTSGPYQYLSRIQAAGASLAGRPAFLARSRGPEDRSR